MTVTKITRRPKVDSQDLGTFLLIIDQFPLKYPISVDMIREDLEAAQISPAAYGGLFAAAVARGVLRPTGRVIRSRKPSRRSGWAQIYTRTQPKAAPKTSRPATKRTDTKGPRR